MITTMMRTAMIAAATTPTITAMVLMESSSADGCFTSGSLSDKRQVHTHTHTNTGERYWSDTFVTVYLEGLL